MLLVWCSVGGWSKTFCMQGVISKRHHFIIISLNQLHVSHVIVLFRKIPFHSCRTCWSDYFITLKTDSWIIAGSFSSFVIKCYKEEFQTFYRCQWPLILVCWLDWYFSDGLCRCVRSLIQHGRGNSNRKDTRRCRQNAKQPYWKSALSSLLFYQCFSCFIFIFAS